MPKASLPSLWLVLAALLFAACSPARTESAAISSNPIPVLAYYYIWFDTQSWERAKTDYPLLGRYSSSNVDVMRQHIQWAKETGITGFIVSWKSTDKLNERLDKLIQVANEENFKLAIIYQGLDFQRNPLPVEQVDADLSYFIEHYSEEQAFYLYDRPLVIWSGTWKFTREQVESVVVGKREHILILASERNVDGYMRLADLVDGDAYYWSSVNPDTFPGYPEEAGCDERCDPCQWRFVDCPGGSRFRCPYDRRHDCCGPEGWRNPAGAVQHSHAVRARCDRVDQLE